MTFFNELDTIAMANGLDAREMIETLCADPHVGNQYNNPSFGYGGYCLPKDSKQLLANFGAVPQQMMRAIVEGNDARKAALARAILARRPQRVGVHRLVMKQGSDNFRQSAVQDIIALLEDAGVEMVIYEPAWTEDSVLGHRVERDLGRFGDACDLIIANRMTPDLVPFGAKVFTRDLFGQN